MSQAWSVRVHVIEAREIKGKGSDGLSDPVVTVEFNGKKETTPQFNNTTAAIFDSLFYFEFTGTKEDMESLPIDIGIWDANTLSSELIGRYELGCGFIYKKKNHELYRTWLGLIDSEKSGTDVQSYMKVSAWVLAEGEEPPAHDGDEDDDDAADLSSMVLTPPDLKQEGYHLLIRVYKAENLPKMDITTMPDTFVQVKFAGNPAQRTKTVFNSSGPVWNSEIRLPVMVPVMANAINVEVYDEGRVGKSLGNRLIGKCTKKFNEVLINDLPPTWFNLYGHPFTTSVSGLIQDGINAITNKASLVPASPPDMSKPSAFNGRILIAMEAEKAEKPKLGSKAIGAAQPPRSDNYLLRFDVLEGAEMSINEWLFEQCVVELQFGGQRVLSKPVTAKSGVCSWYQAFDEIRLALPVDLEDIHDCFINVYKQTPVIGTLTRIGFQRVVMRELDGFNERPRWHMLTPDPFRRLEVGAIPGYLQYSLQFGRERNKPAKGRKKIRKPPLTPYMLRAHIYQARDLMAADDAGTSDPYVVVRFGGASAKTPVIKETLFPVFFCSLELEVMVPEPMSLAPEISLMVWDYDPYDGDDMIGRCTVPVDRIKPAMPRLPKWRALHMDDEAKPQGAVLVAFQLIPKSDASRFPKVDIRPPTRECVFEIAVLGVRDLQPYMLLDCDAPSVEFDAGDAADDPSRLKSTKQGSSTNSTFLQTLALPLNIPENPLFAQNLNIKCYDNRMFSKPLVGLTSVSVADYIPWPIIQEEVSSSESDGESSDDVSEGDLIPPEMSLWNVDVEEAVAFVTPTSAKDKARKASGKVDESGVDVDEDDNGSDDEGAKGKERPKVDGGLEIELDDLPFHEFTLTRGNAQAVLFGGAQASGVLKARFRVVELARRNLYSPPINLQERFSPQPYIVRAYILRGIGLAPKDPSGLSDPYAVVRIGDGKKPEHYRSFEENKQEETLNPDLYVSCEMKVVLPGTTNLTVEIWDYDLAVTHELIGQTRIDMENRVLSDKWKAMKLKPMEYRSLTRPTAKAAVSQGKIEMWLDIMTPEEARVNPLVLLERPAPAAFMLRVVVWRCKDVINDEEPKTDLYCSGQLSGAEEAHEQNTDTHWGSNNTDNTPEFNWRFLFPLELYQNMEKNPRLQLGIWDADVVGSNDALGEAIISLKPLFKLAMKKNESAKVEGMWVQCTHPNFEGVRGLMLIDLEVLPMADHDLAPVGKGREAPNENPFLATPDRPSMFDGLLDLVNPFGFFGALKKRLMMCCGCVIVVVVIYVMLSMP